MTEKNQPISFNRGVPATQSLPSRKVGEVTAEVLREEGDTLLQYGDSRGYLPLREKIVDGCENPTEDQVLVGNGSLQILDMITHIYVEQGDSVLVEKPSYDRAITLFRRAGAKVSAVSLEKDGMNLDELAELLERDRPSLIYTIADFQNPTGITATTEKRKALTELAAKYGTIVVEDSPYRNLRYRGEVEPTVRSFDPDNILRLSSYSKLVSPGMRVGWLVGKSEVIEELADYAEDTYITPNLLSQGIVSKLMGSGWLEENIKQLVSLYEPRLRATLESLEKYFPESDWVEAEGGFFVGLWLPDPSKVDQFYEKAEGENLILSSPDGFFADGESEGFLRLPFPALSVSEIETGVKRLARAWKEL